MKKVNIEFFSLDEICDFIKFNKVDNCDTLINKVGLSNDFDFWGIDLFRKVAVNNKEFVEKSLLNIIDYIKKHSICLDKVIICDPVTGLKNEFEYAVKDVISKQFGYSIEIDIVSGYGCVGLIKAVEKSQFELSENSSVKNFLVVSGERIEEDAKRLKKYSLNSDYIFSFLINNDIERRAYIVEDCSVLVDRSRKNDDIAFSDLDAQCLNEALNNRSYSIEDIDSVHYLNLFPPISKMKLKSLDFKNEQISKSGSIKYGHCYSADPFINLQGENDLDNGALVALVASSSTSAGVLFLSKDIK